MSLSRIHAMAQRIVDDLRALPPDEMEAACVIFGCSTDAVMLVAGLRLALRHVEEAKAMAEVGA